MDVKIRNSIYAMLITASIGLSVLGAYLSYVTGSWVIVIMIAAGLLCAKWSMKKLDEGIDEFMEGLFKK